MVPRPLTLVLCTETMISVHSFSHLLLGLNEANPASIPLVNDTNFVGFFIAEDVEIMINVVKCENSFLNGDWLTQVKTKLLNRVAEGGK
jgi:hypothetical protein